jgi:hypothetical protein
MATAMAVPIMTITGNEYRGFHAHRIQAVFFPWLNLILKYDMVAGFCSDS